MSAVKLTSPANVCLVRPPTLTNVGAVGQDAVPPIGLAYVASSLEVAGHRVTAVDAVGEAVHQYSRVDWGEEALVHGLDGEEIAERVDPNANVIGVSCMFSVEWLVTKEVIEALRRAFPQALIVLGGEHVTACADFSLESCRAADVAVLGEGEETMVDLVNAYAEGRPLDTVNGIVFRRDDALVVTPARARIRSIDDIPKPNWTLFPIEAYIDNALTHGANLGRCMPLLASRGCPYQCTFCSNPLMWGTRWLARKPELVLEEMQEYIARYDVTNFDFYDLTAIVKKEWIVDFTQLLIEENMKITWQLPSGTRSEALDEEVTRLLYESGCRIINYAPESGSPSELKRIKKKVQPDRMLASMRGAVQAGLQVKSNFIFGLPGSSWRDVATTFGFIARMARVGVHDMNAFPFSPYPGSELFDDLVEAGKVKMDAEYFRTLLAYTDPAHSVSYADFIGSTMLSFVCMSAMGFFYACSFVMRPRRFFNLVGALVRRDSSTKLTMALANRRRKQEALKAMRRAGRDRVVVGQLVAPRAPTR